MKNDFTNGFIHILVIEDEPASQVLFSYFVKPLLDKWPKSKITIVGTVDAGVSVINDCPAPDAVLLDLHTPDSEIKETVERIGAMDERSPLVVVTGFADERLRGLIADHIQVLDKGIAFTTPGLLVSTIIKTIAFWHTRRWNRISGYIATLKELHGVT